MAGGAEGAVGGRQAWSGGVGVDPSWSCRKKDLKVSITRNRRTTQVWPGDSPGVWSGTLRCALLAAEMRPGTVPTGRNAVGITCRDGDPAVTLLWPCRGQDSPNALGPPRQGTKPLAVKARNRAARLRALCPSCQPLPTHGQRSAEAVGEAGRLSQAPRERPARPPCSARKARGLRFRLPGPRDVTSAGPGRALRACARPRGLPACLAGSWSGVALALCAEVTPATPPAQPAARPTRALQHGHGVDLPDGRAVAWSSPAHAGLGPSETLCRGV